MELDAVQKAQLKSLQTDIETDLKYSKIQSDTQMALRYVRRLCGVLLNEPN